MNRSDIVASVATKTDLPKVKVNIILDAVLETMSEALIAGDKVTLSDFGTFEVSTRKPFMGRNPKTGEALEVPERKIPTFKAGKGLKESMNK